MCAIYVRYSGEYGLRFEDRAVNYICGYDDEILMIVQLSGNLGIISRFLLRINLILLPVYLGLAFIFGDELI